MNRHSASTMPPVRTREATHPGRCDDSGAALLTVIAAIVLISALTATLAMVTTSNLVSARLTQQAGAALNASDAGIAQAVTYLRTTGAKRINRCSPACATEPWGNSTNPAVVTVPGAAGQSYRVWIEVLAPYPDYVPGRYRIHATGTAGGPAGRTVTSDVEITPYQFPMGIMANSVNGGGTADVHRESVFSTGCVYKRSKIDFDGIDAYYNIPAAVHTSQIITDSQGSGQFCPSTKQPIHDTRQSGGAKNCNPLYPFDQDRNGGPLNGTTCYQAHSSTYPLTSLIASDAELFSLYKMKQPVFSQSQLDQLKSIAVSQNNYYTTATGWTSPTTADAVMYFDLTATDPGGLVDLNDLTGWSRSVPLAADDPACPARSLAIIIEGGNMRLNSNSVLFASVFLTSGDPYGQVFKANGTATYIGTLYSNGLDLTGTADFWLDKCFVSNVSPALTDVVTYNYREIDR